MTRGKIRQKAAVLTACFLIFLFAIPCMAEGTSHVYDNALLLSDSEIDSIGQLVDKIEKETGWEVFVVTTDDAAGETTQSYNEFFLNDHLSGDDGISYIVDLDNGEIQIATTGIVTRYMTDERIDSVLDGGYEYASDEDYAGCFEAMLDATYDYYSDGIPSDQYNYDSDTGEVSKYQEPKTLEWYEVLIAVALACAAGGITFSVVVGKYRLKWGTYKYDYHANGTLSLTKKEDHFVNEIVTHHHIPKNPPSSGGGSQSTVHTGAGGRSYGGGGRKL